MSDLEDKWAESGTEVSYKFWLEKKVSQLLEAQRVRITKDEPPTEADAVNGSVLGFLRGDRIQFWVEMSWDSLSENGKITEWMPLPPIPTESK